MKRSLIGGTVLVAAILSLIWIFLANRHGVVAGSPIKVRGGSIHGFALNGWTQCDKDTDIYCATVSSSDRFILQSKYFDTQIAMPGNVEWTIRFTNQNGNGVLLCSNRKCDAVTPVSGDQYIYLELNDKVNSSWLPITSSSERLFHDRSNRCEPASPVASGDYPGEGPCDKIVKAIIYFGGMAHPKTLHCDDHYKKQCEIDVGNPQ
jgi:hypothetical protein